MQSHLIQCNVSNLSYEFNLKAGVLYIGEGECVDGPGCITLFLRIDPEVRDIRTFAGRMPDTRYRRLPDGRWQTIDEDNRVWPPSKVIVKREVDDQLHEAKGHV